MGRDDALTISGAQITRRTLAQADTDATVGALLFVAPMLIRRQHVRLEIDFPLNRIRTHLEALRDLGIDTVSSSGAVEFKTASWDCKDIVLTQASVTATALVMMLAARLGKTTTIHNAACEPHIQELGHLLQAMGAQVEGIGSNVLRIGGVDELGGADVTIGPDHIEAASVAAIGALVGRAHPDRGHSRGGHARDRQDLLAARHSARRGRGGDFRAQAGDAERLQPRGGRRLLD